MNLRERINAEVEKNFPRMIEIRRALHAYPELGYEEVRTSGRIASELKKLGIVAKTGIAKTGVAGVLKGRKPGRTVALRADMDALPIHELNTFGFRSTVDGKMHACGHDAHTAMALGAAMVLTALRDDVEGSVKFIFEPSEEKNPPGAREMVREGVLRNPPVDVIFGLHVDPHSGSGVLGFCDGPMMAAADEVSITIHGKGGHGSRPQETVDPIVISAQVIAGLQAVISRNRDPLEPSVLTFGCIRGGEARNVIPDEVRIEGTLRTMSEAWRSRSRRLIQRAVEGMAKAGGASADIEFRDGACAVINTTRVNTFARQCGLDYAGKTNVTDIPVTMAAETFGYFLQKVPGTFFRLGVGDRKKRIVRDLHTPRFTLDEEAMKTGAGFLAYLTIEYLRSH